MGRLIFLSLLLMACGGQETVTEYTILKEGSINRVSLEQLHEPERALLLWYLYAYGNTCSNNGQKAKCHILGLLEISDECNPNHLQFLRKWMSKDKLAVFKLQNCKTKAQQPAFQNTIEHIVLRRKNDFLTIHYTIKGLNGSQEKSWNIEQKDAYAIEGNSLVKISSVKF